jgi:gamma-glutamylcyclotransferase (GGCT)/AIG2-like uncharacterized protein YtfP
MHLFVYGTLRSRYTNQYARRLAANATLLGEARVHGRLYDLGDYPGMLLSAAPDEWVVGELYELRDAALLTGLDAYEGDDFRRVSTTAMLGGGREVETCIYEYAGSPAESQRICSGDFTGPR